MSAAAAETGYAVAHAGGAPRLLIGGNVWVVKIYHVTTAHVTMTYTFLPLGSPRELIR